MSVIEQLRQLEEQKKTLIDKAKSEALQQAEDAISTLRELGFHYRLVEANAAVTRNTTTGTRRTGIRDDVLRVIQEHGEGISRADILEQMEAKGDKRAEQSISNALSNLKKSDVITLEDGLYTVSGAP